jgi:hypothetical protein
VSGLPVARLSSSTMVVIRGSTHTHHQMRPHALTMHSPGRNLPPPTFTRPHLDTTIQTITSPHLPRFPYLTTSSSFSEALGIDGFLLTVHTFASTALGRRFYYASIYAFSRSSLTFIYYLHTSIVVGVLWQLDWAIQEIQFISGIRHVYEHVIYVHCFEWCLDFV